MIAYYARIRASPACQHVTPSSPIPTPIRVGWGLGVVTGFAENPRFLERCLLPI